MILCVSFYYSLNINTKCVDHEAMVRKQYSYEQRNPMKRFVLSNMRLQCERGFNVLVKIINILLYHYKKIISNILESFR